MLIVDKYRGEELKRTLRENLEERETVWALTDRARESPPGGAS